MTFLSMQYWQSHLLLSLIMIGLFGLIIGSFLNVVVYRLPRILYQDWQIQYGNLNGETSYTSIKFNLAVPRSHCPKCHHQLQWWENIPLLSYLILLGHCSNCKKIISLRYPFIELLSVLLSIYLTWHYGISLALSATLLFSWILLILSVIDLNEQILPDLLTLSLLWLGLIYNINGLFIDTKSAIIGAISGYLFLWIIAFVFKKLTHKEGIGLGDCKLLAALGAWLGWQLLPLVILFASLMGSIIGITLIILKKINRQTPIPFGPFLALAGWIGLLWGPQIMHASLIILR